MDASWSLFQSVISSVSHVDNENYFQSFKHLVGMLGDTAFIYYFQLCSEQSLLLNYLIIYLNYFNVNP